MQRLITDEACLQQFLETNTFRKFQDFIKDLSKSCNEIDIRTPIYFAAEFRSFLANLSTKVKNYETSSLNSRYGDYSFRIWLDQARPDIESFFDKHIRENVALQEICEYMDRSLGSRERLDYGTGHELSFICVLFYLKELGLLSQSDYGYIAQEVFLAYWILVRNIQRKFLLEPAGSLGVWGLDDFNYLPFLFGAAQLENHPYLKPCSVRDSILVEQYKDKYMYFTAIHNINTESDASLRERSPILYDITSVKSWSKVYNGLLKMYKCNVLSKVPVMQHFYFGRLICFEHSSCASSEQSVVYHSGDCCGNRLPSIHASKKASDIYKFPMD